MDAEIVVQPVEYLGEEAQWCMAEYFKELADRFLGGFEQALGAPTDADELTPPNGYFLLATRGQDSMGCVAVRMHEGWAEVKRMWVAPGARRTGLGRGLLAEAEDLAAAKGSTIVRLDTNSALPEAVELYRSSGYREIERFNDNPYAHHWFEKELD